MNCKTKIKIQKRNNCLINGIECDAFIDETSMVCPQTQPHDGVYIVYCWFNHQLCFIADFPHHFAEFIDFRQVHSHEFQLHGRISIKPLYIYSKHFRWWNHSSSIESFMCDDDISIGKIYSLYVIYDWIKIIVYLIET